MVTAGQVGRMVAFEKCRILGLRARRVIGVPGVGDDDVVEGRMALAEARKTDLENHDEWSCVLFCSESTRSTVSILRRLLSNYRRCKRRLSQ